MSVLLQMVGVSAALGATRALVDLSLSVQPGELIALLGPNGAGKTTLLRAALGFIAPQAGTVLLGDADPRALSSRTRARRAAYMPQQPSAAWPIPVESLVALGRFAHGGVPERLSVEDRRAVDAAIAVCDLERLRSRRMDELSGGERMRAHLARTLAQRAPLLLLDEPTAGLDPAQALGVAEILRVHAAKNGAVLFSTHDIALAANGADRVLLIQGGACIAEGAPATALNPEALERAYGRPGRLEDIKGGLVATFR